MIHTLEHNWPENEETNDLPSLEEKSFVPKNRIDEYYTESRKAINEVMHDPASIVRNEAKDTSEGADRKKESAKKKKTTEKSAHNSEKGRGSESGGDGRGGDTTGIPEEEPGPEDRKDAESEIAAKPNPNGFVRFTHWLRHFREGGAKDAVATTEFSAAAVGAGMATNWYASTATFGNALLQPGFMAPMLSNTVALGASTLNIVPPIVGGAWIGGEQLAAIRHRKRVKTNFDDSVDRTLNTSLSTNEKDAEKKVITDDFQRLKEQSSKNLLNHADEVDLIKAFDKVMPSPADVPYLGTEGKYVEYMYHELIKFASLDGDHSSLAGLLQGEKAALRKYAPQFLRKEEIAQGLEDGMRRKIHDVCASYGRLVCYHHARKRGRILNGAVAGLSVTSAAALGGVLPLLTGGIFIGGRWLYHKARSEKQGLEFGPDGRVRGKGDTPMLNPETTDASGLPILHKPELLQKYKKEEDLTADEKKWLPLIKIPQARLKLRYATADQLMINCAADVAQNLIGKEGAKEEPDEDDVEQKKIDLNRAGKVYESLLKERSDLDREISKEEGYKEASKKEKARLVELEEKEIKDLDKLKDIDIEIDNTDAAILKSIEAENEKELKKLEEQLQEMKYKKSRKSDLEKRSKKSIDDYKKRMTNQEMQIDRHNTNIEAKKMEKIALQSQIDEAKEAEKIARADLKQSKDGEGAKILDLPKIAEDEKIARAFAVAVNQQFEVLQQRRGKYWSAAGTGASAVATSTPVKELAKGVAVTGMYAGLGATAVSLLSNVPVLGGAASFLSPTIAAGLAGGFGLVRYVKERIVRS